MDFQIPQEVIQQQLQGDERLLWSGRPAGGIRFRKQDIFMVPFSLIFGCIAISWEIVAISIAFSGKPQSEDFSSIINIFPLFGIPFVIIGLYLIFGRFWVDAKNRQNTYYGVTSRRIIILSGLFFRSIKSLYLETLTDISITQKPDGSGTIFFGRSNLISWLLFRRIASLMLPPPLEMIENVSDVYRIITEARKDWLSLNTPKHKE